MGKTVKVYGFPSRVTAEAAKSYLESHTGEGTIEALKMRQAKNHPRSYAIVQFTTIEKAEYVVSRSRQLYFGTSYLKVQAMDHDVIPRPKTFLHVIEGAVLHFGCQTSREKFSDLWRATDVLMKFGHGMRKLHFYLSHHGTDYKLDLRYENIWQIELHRPRGQHVKYLVFQLFGAPRIFEKDVRMSFNSYDGPLWNFYKAGSDDQWVRTTDFTQSCRIGHASSLCLEIPHDFRLLDLADSDGKFILEDGSPFSQNPSLVPIVGPPLKVDLPFEILFKVNLLVQNGCLPGPALDADFYKLVDPQRVPIVWIQLALEKLFYLKECCYEPSRWLQEQYTKHHGSQNPARSPAISLDDGLVYTHRIQITPCKVYFAGPEVNVSNRVLRHFPDDIENFIRVSFVDEELDKIHSTDVASRGSSVQDAKKRGIYNRIFSTLRDGIVIGGKKFEFLAFSASQLRENSCWMFASRYGLTADDIRKWMGDFHGIGKISAQFAKRVAAKCGSCNGSVPSAFQIRYGGYKGVVAVDPTSTKKLSLRKSMFKYASENTKLDVLAYSKYQPCFMNRQNVIHANGLCSNFRPHPNECSGSDLDGDIYFVCWDSELIPPEQIPPMDYTPQPTMQLDHDVTIEVPYILHTM
ncbi:unnamed protein product [Linum tenue]|uniref:RNA-dependent RNA polymerase n=1 Tax=Linum tenue TaxID=586396 RepID=A0AAV0R5Z5_9ROSI|nr:unnamed protein product [Linum tenue]